MVKKLQYLLFLFPFLLLIDVNASTVGGNQADSPVYSVVSTNYNNVPVRLWTSNIFGSDIVNYSSVVNDYVYVTACTDMPTLGYSYVPFYNSTTGNTASATEIRYVANLTSKTCTFNTGATGKVAYLKFRLISDLLNVPQGSSDTTWLYNSYITLYIGTSSPFSFSIQNISALDADLDIYSTDFDVSLLSQQNQQIINNQNNNTNSIINNQDSNTQDIIDNQNQNTQDIINNQDETFGNLCYTNLFDGEFEQGSISSTGVYQTVLTTIRSKNFIEVHANEILTISNNENYKFNRIMYYDSNQTFISRTNSMDDSTILIPNNTNIKYIKFTVFDVNNITPNDITNTQIVEGEQVLPYVPYGQEKCINKLDEQINAINDLNDTLNSEDTPNTNQDIADMDDMVASDTPISDLITMPLTLINAYINGLNSTCSPVNLGNLYGTNLIIPCIDIPSKIGNDLWGKIDVICCIFMCYEIGMLFITAFDGITSLRDDFEGLYQPRHADLGYQPKHGGGN